MHISSLENMDRSLAYYAGHVTGRIIDMGSMNVNGSYKDILGDDVEYVGVDLEPGPGVNVVLDDPYKLPFDDSSAELIISGQMLEHCAFFWKTFEEIERILQPEGLCIMIAPSAGPAHYNVDYYRFYADAWSAIAEWTGLRIVDHWIDPRGPWKDNVCIFQKGGTLEKITQPKPRTPNFHKPFIPSVAPAAISAEPTSEQSSTDRYVSDYLRQVAPQRYLQIGSGLKDVTLPGTVISINRTGTDHPAGAKTHSFQATSDDVFHFGAPEILGDPIDVAYIRAAGTFDDAYRDLANLEPHMAKSGRILIDMINPGSEAAGMRTTRPDGRPGDVWRLVNILKRHRPDLGLEIVDTHPHGLLIIDRLKPNNPILNGRYNSIVIGTINQDAAWTPAAV